MKYGILISLKLRGVTMSVSLVNLWLPILLSGLNSICKCNDILVA